MQFSALAFLIGVLLCQQLAQLPDPRWTTLLLGIIPAIFIVRNSAPSSTLHSHPVKGHLARIDTQIGRSWGKRLLWYGPLLIIAGFLWAVFMANLQLNHILTPDLEGKDLLATGVISTLPDETRRRSRFEFTVYKMETGDGKSNVLTRRLPLKLRLSWYWKRPRLRAGQRWRLRVRLKRPNGYMNPGGFDYEQWLFHKGISATGYVVTRHQTSSLNTGWNVMLDAGVNGQYVNRVRQYFKEAIDKALPQDPMAGMIKALIIGDRQGISQDQWQILLRTGTNHLLAISGLHIGLIAGLAFFLARWLWSCSARAVLWLAAPRAASIAAILAAMAYAALAGFAIPTQRALIMVIVIMMSVYARRQVRPSYTLSLALFGVLVLDPMAVLDAGFWLSFAAVAVILLGMVGRLPWQFGHWSRWWWRWGRAQWLVAIGLLPLLLFFFQRLSLVAPLANLLAVPWVSLLVVPLTLMGAVLLMLWPSAGSGLLHLASACLQAFWWLVNGLARWPLSQWAHEAPPAWLLLPSVVGIIWLLAPRGFPARWLGLFWLSPVLLWHPVPLELGEARLTLLDVGQGLSTVVQTRHHILVFDTGPRFNHNFDTGEAVVVPYLHQVGMNYVDTLVISHGDNDHIGGAQSLLKRIPTHEVLSSVVNQIPWASAHHCRRGTQWQWDGVIFQVLHPGTKPFPGDAKVNNLSCVLRVQSRHGSALLTGDIESAAEQQLIVNSRVQTKGQPQTIHADILVVPHHGSRTSSSEDFIRAVAPSFALFPVGYRNRYGFPKPAIVERYLRHNITLLDTAKNGAISFILGKKDGVHLQYTWRQAAHRYWHRQVIDPISEINSSAQ